MPILETAAVSMSGKTLSYLISLVGLATAGAVDGANVVLTDQSLLANTGLPMEGQLGLSALFLAGFVYLAKKFLDSQDERFKLLTDHIAKLEKAHSDQVKKLEEEKATLVARVQVMNDEVRQRLNRELDEHRS